MSTKPSSTEFIANIIRGRRIFAGLGACPGGELVSSGEETDDVDRAVIETFPNPYPGRGYLIEHVAHEFTSMCPKTGEPDFATMKILYVAGPSCLELKSLKQYLQRFRSKGIYYEAVTNLILDDLVAACQPKWMLVESAWNIRGGMHSVISAQHGQRPAHKPSGVQPEG